MICHKNKISLNQLITSTISTIIIYYYYFFAYIKIESAQCLLMIVSIVVIFIYFVSFTTVNITFFIYLFV